MSQPRAAAGGLRRLDAVVSGRVQGVGYRVFVLRLALDLGLTGWVANLPDGAVRCVAEGEQDALDRLVDGLRRGPAAALVEGVLTGWPPPTGEFSDFSLRSGWHGGD